MCAKVTGPLLSFDASGTVGKTATYSKWKGRNYTRLRVVPKNPQSASQGITRTIMGAIGKVIRAISPTGILYTQLSAVVPADQGWNGYFTREMSGSNFANFEASRTAYELVDNATVKGYFDAEAASLGLTGFELPYTPVGEDVPGGLALWAAADAAFRLGLAIAPEIPEDMSEGEVTAFAAAFLSA